jgi:hypothetical protein
MRFLPLDMRQSTKSGMLKAKSGIIISVRDAPMIPNRSTGLGPNRFARIPPGTCVSMYPQKKLERITPFVESFQLYNVDIGISAIERFTRSIKRIVIANNPRMPNNCLKSQFFYLIDQTFG